MSFDPESFGKLMDNIRGGGIRRGSIEAALTQIVTAFAETEILPILAEHRPVDVTLFRDKVYVISAELKNASATEIARRLSHCNAQLKSYVDAATALMITVDSTRTYLAAVWRWKANAEPPVHFVVSGARVTITAGLAVSSNQWLKELGRNAGEYTSHHGVSSNREVAYARL